MKKKVLFFHFDLGGGGAEKVLVNLLNQLDLNKYDITLYTIFGDGVNKQYLRPEIPHKYIFKKKFRGFTSIMKLFSPQSLHKLFIKDQYDIEIAYIESSPTRIISGCPNSQTKKIAWVHIQLDELKKFFSPYRTITEAEQCYHKFDKIIFVSKFAEKVFISKTGWKALDTETIYNTNDINTINRLAQEPINLELDKSLINICSVGRMVSQKGFDRLIEVFKKLKSDQLIHRCHLYLLGTGEDLEKLKDEVKINKLEDTITFLGYQNNPYKYVSKMDLFICSSRKEGFSTAVTESILLQTPVLTTDCSGMDEILLSGKFGMIVENNTKALYDGLKTILQTPQILDEKKKELKKGYTHLNHSVKDVEDLLDSL